MEPAVPTQEQVVTTAHVPQDIMAQTVKMKLMNASQIHVEMDPHVWSVDNKYITIM